MNESTGHHISPHISQIFYCAPESRTIVRYEFCEKCGLEPSCLPNSASQQLSIPGTLFNSEFQIPFPDHGFHGWPRIF